MLRMQLYYNDKKSKNNHKLSNNHILPCLFYKKTFKTHVQTENLLYITNIIFNLIDSHLPNKLKKRYCDYNN